MTGLVAGCGGGSSNESATNAAKVSPAKTSTGAISQARAEAPVRIALSEWMVSPGTWSAEAGTVVFNVTNTGTRTHEMVVVRTSKPAAALAHGGSASEAGSVGEVADLESGETKTLSLALKPGHYALICNEPGHYKAGMHIDFVVS